MEEAVVVDLPPGYRFHPTDEELIAHYLSEKVKNSGFTAYAIGEVDLNKCEPWDLPKKAKMGENQWYFFCQRDKKYPTGTRTNRATVAGYWKATGKDREIHKSKNCLIGMKKTLVFYTGRAPKGEKTNWVMHEYRLEGQFSFYNLPKFVKDDWVLCRVFHKSSAISKPSVHDLLRVNSFDFLDHLPPLMDPPSSNRPSSSLVGLENDDVFKTIASGSMVTFLHHQEQQFPNLTFQTMPSLSNPSYGENDKTLLRTLAGNVETSINQDKECNQSVVTLSQDTGVRIDMNTAAAAVEISSAVSGQECGSKYEDFDDLDEGPSSPVADFDSLWNYISS